MAKSRTLFKTTTNVHAESIANADWSSFLRLDKLQDSFKSAYVDKVRISYISGEDDVTDNQGWLFCASLDDALDSSTPSNNDGQIIGSTAGRGAGGVVVLPVKRTITSNETASNETGSGFPIYCHVRAAVTGNTQKLYMVVEVMGRLHRATAL